MQRDQDQGRSATNPAGNLHRPSLPSIRDMFPEWDDNVGGSTGRGISPYPHPSQPPSAHSQAALPYSQSQHLQYARGHQSIPPQHQSRGPMPVGTHPVPQARAGAPPPLPPSHALSPPTRQASAAYGSQPPGARGPLVYPPPPTSRPPAPPNSAPTQGGYILLRPTASGGLREQARSDDPRGLSSIHNLVSGQREDDRDGRHVCPICDHAFDRPSTLQTHMNAHRGLRPYLCPQCGRGFSASSNMRRHERTCRGGQGGSNEPQSPSSPSSTSS